MLEVRRGLSKENLCPDGNEKMVLASGYTAKPKFAHLAGFFKPVADQIAHALHK